MSNIYDLLSKYTKEEFLDGPCGSKGCPADYGMKRIRDCGGMSCNECWGKVIKTNLLQFKSPTEFTFQEVIARIKEGETYEAINKIYATQKITMKKNKDIRIDILSDQTYIMPTYSLFKLQEPKKRITIYKVEHKQDGKKYDFISSQLLQEAMFVVCDTSQGKSYGRIVDAEDRELTESEIKEYKECWRA